MSYIFDALQRSEAQRQAAKAGGESVPPAAAPDIAPLTQPRRQTHVAGRWLLIGVCLALLMWAAWFYKTAPADAPAMPQSQDETLALAPGGTGQTGNPGEAASADKKLSTAATTEPSEKASSPALPPKVPALEPARPQEPKVKAPTVKASIPTRQELPPQVQSRLPALQVGGAVSGGLPQQRLLMLDGEMRQEGDWIAPGLQLIQIDRQQAILQLDGQGFRVVY